MPDLRYPIGKFSHEGPISDELIAFWIDDVAALPAGMRTAVEGLTDEQLDTPYRPGGWTIRQVVHHVPDSHVNAYVRFKLALTEDHPTIKTYDEKGWASLPDVGITPIETNLKFLELLHEKWVELLRSVSREDFSRPFMHPINGITPLDWNLGHYAWHGRHHLAHITSTIERNAWRKARR